MTRPINTSASHHAAHSLWSPPVLGMVDSHIPGLDIEVTWTTGYAEQTRDDFDRAVAQIRAQIVDAEEPSE